MAANSCSGNAAIAFWQLVLRFVSAVRPDLTRIFGCPPFVPVANRLSPWWHYLSDLMGASPQELSRCAHIAIASALGLPSSAASCVAKLPIVELWPSRGIPPCP